MEVHVQSYGASVRMRDGLLSVKFEKEVKQIPLAKVKTLTLHRGVLITSDVLYQCLEYGVEVVLLERGGRPAGRMWNNKFGSVSTIRKKQIDFSRSDRIIPWVVANMQEKIANQSELLLCFMSMHEPDESLISQSVTKLESYSMRLNDYLQLPLDEAAGKIRALEGQAAKAYFMCVNEHLPFQYQFSKRSKRPALDMVNAMLNYTYGSLYARLEAGLIKAGLDPFIGFFHRDEYNRPVLTYDVIEPFRPWADWVVFHLCSHEVLDETFFEVEDGGYWMMGDGKRILVQHFVDFFEEVIDYDGMRFSRQTHLDKRCGKIASMIQNMEGDE